MVVPDKAPLLSTALVKVADAQVMLPAPLSEEQLKIGFVMHFLTYSSLRYSVSLPTVVLQLL